MIRRLFKVTEDELPMAHVRWGAVPARAHGRLLFSASRVGWWRRSHDAGSLGWCESALLGEAFGGIGPIPGPPRLLEQVFEAAQAFQPGEPRHAGLEAEICNTPDDLSLRWVYLDWLGTQGHPRSWLAQMDPTSTVFTELIVAHRWEFGPFWRHRNMRVDWFGGFVDSLRVRGRSQADLKGLLLHPSARFLRTLRVNTATPRDLRETVERLRSDLPLLEAVEIR